MADYRVALDVERVIALRKQGWTCKRIAEEFGTSEQTVRRRLDDAGITVTAYRYFTTKEIRTAREVLEGGGSWADVAKLLGRDNAKTVAAYMARYYGLRSKTRWMPRRWTPERLAQLSSVYVSHGRTKAAELFDICPKTANQVMRRARIAGR